MRCLPNFLMREAINAILGRLWLPPVAIIYWTMKRILRPSMFIVVFYIFRKNLVAYISSLFVLLLVDVMLLSRINQWAR